MNCLLVLLSTLVVLAAVQTHAVHQPAAGEVYWNKVLPNTPIPTAIKELITPSVTVSVKPLDNRQYNAHAEDQVQTTRPLTRVFYNAHDEAQVSDYKDASYFFLEEDLKPGNKLTWQFSRTTPSGQTLLISHEEANSVPFTSAKFPNILNHFSIQPNSEVAKIMY